MGGFTDYNRDKKRTFVFVYFAGHGMMKTRTLAVLNQPEHPLYALDEKCNIMGSCPGVFVYAVYDCCRENVTPKIEASIVELKQQHEAGRGAGDVEDLFKALEVIDKRSHVISTFGCQPGAKVAERSTVAVDFFKELKDHANGWDGAIFLPHEALQQKYDQQQTYKIKLKLKHVNWKKTCEKPADYDEDVAAANVDEINERNNEIMGQLKALLRWTQKGGDLPEPIEIPEEIRPEPILDEDLDTLQKLGECYSAMENYKATVLANYNKKNKK